MDDIEIRAEVEYTDKRRSEQVLIHLHRKANELGVSFRVMFHKNYRIRSSMTAETKKAHTVMVLSSNTGVLAREAISKALVELEVVFK